MDWERRCIRLCAAVLCCAVVLRLWSGGALAPVGQALGSKEAASFFLYLHTGRVIRQVPQPRVPEPEPSTVPQTVTFTPEDTAYIALDDTCGAEPEVERLLTAPLEPVLTGEGPRVLILHSHTTESYTQTGEGYTESSPYRTLDPEHNMIALGDIVADILTEAGIGVIHDRELHDYPSYNGAYTHAAGSTRAYLEQYPSIGLILDLHRDAAETATGEQMATGCTIDGEQAAQLMFVLGTDTRLQHPDWEDNLSLALKLQVLLEKETPGICRRLSLSKNRYNQHLGRYALIVEIGAAGNTLDQARPAAVKLAEAIVKLAQMQNAE